MTTLLLLITITIPTQAPLSDAEAETKQLAAWVADLSGGDLNQQNAARDALMKAGPKAKAFVPDLIKIIGDKSNQGSWAWSHAVEVLGAIGPDAKDATPLLTPLVEPDVSGVMLDRVAVALAKIEGAKPKTTQALLLSTGKGRPIVLAGCNYLRENPVSVAGHLLAMCKDKNPEVRRRSVIVLAGLATWLFNETKPLALEVGDAGKDAPAVFETMLVDEDPIVRMTAAHGLSRVAPKKTVQTIPAVIATMTDPKLQSIVAGVPAAEIFRPIPQEAAQALIPLFDGPDQGRWWAINTLAALPVRAQLEAALADGKTARTREAAALTLGSRSSDGVLAAPALKSALVDREFSVRFAAATALVNIGARGSETAAAGLPVLIEGLKQEDKAIRSSAAQHLRIVGKPARLALPELKRVLGDKEPEVALEAALALVEINPVEAAEAIPALIEGLKSTNETRVAPRAARALGVLGPIAKPAIPELVKGLASESPHLRIAAAEAAGRIDPDCGEKAAQVLVATFKQYKGGTFRHDAAKALILIGPPAKGALPTLLEELDKLQNRSFFLRLEIALTVMAIDPETGKSVAAWIREHVTKDGDEIDYDLARQIRQLGTQAKPLMGELIAMLGSKKGYLRECAALALGEIGSDAKDALPRLKELAEKDGNPNFRKLAANAIAKIEAH